MRSILKKNKRGDISSLIIGLVVLIFAIGLISVMFSKFFLELTDIIKQEESIANNTNAMETISVVEENTIPWLDTFFLFCFVSTIIGIIVSSIYIDVHPALMIIFIIILLVAVVFAGIFSNVFGEIGEDDSVVDTYNEFVAMKAIMSNLPLILFVTGIIVVFILYGKGRGGGGPM
jgi:hypothetical protein